MARITRKKMAVALAVFASAVMLALAVLLYLLTIDVPVAWAQDPNPVELIEANRKLKLLNDALAAKRKGFIPLSEVEINSFLENRYVAQTNSPADLPEFRRAAILLHGTNLTFITWLAQPVAGFKLPFVWQRDLHLQQEGSGASFHLSAMRLGDLTIPPFLWERVVRVFGPSDQLFEERRVWLRSLPAIALVKNDITRAPELRLYTYNPEARPRP